ncbi:MAG TPA: hypothetical protein VFV77_10115 [Gammaproteobacteria bacterium]|nr:hypothetical protein [Gammaproteobacteria bacterium]
MSASQARVVRVSQPPPSLSQPPPLSLSRPPVSVSRPRPTMSLLAARGG